MGQIFRPSANVYAKVGALSLFYLIILVLLALAVFDRSNIIRRINVPREQPVPFTHQMHAGVLGMDCIYCHSSVEKSKYAGMPSLDTCMACHNEIQGTFWLEWLTNRFEEQEPVRWTRVTDFPDFVYFNHSIHVQGRGLDCSECHGIVEEMTVMWKAKSLTMGYCLDTCHRTTWNIEQLTNCSVCHR
jgi:hypothetical protein